MSPTEYKSLQGRLEKDYFVVKKGPAWFALAGAITSLIALFGITIITIRTSIKSRAEIATLQAMVKTADLMAREIEDDRDAAQSASDAVNEILAETPNVPGDIAKLNERIDRLNRIDAIEKELAIREPQIEK